MSNSDIRHKISLLKSVSSYFNVIPTQPQASNHCRMNKYNLAFIPKYKSNEFVNLAKRYIDSHKNYILGPQSIPHVTVCQFISEEESLEGLYNKIHTMPFDSSIELVFNKFSHISFDGIIYWLSLLPENSGKLYAIFNKASQFIRPIRSDAYDPHLTLFNYSAIDNDLVHFWDDQFNIKDAFELVIGQSDAQGQLTKVIKKI